MCVINTLKDYTNNDYIVGIEIKVLLSIFHKFTNTFILIMNMNQLPQVNMIENKVCCNTHMSDFLLKGSFDQKHSRKKKYTNFLSPKGDQELKKCKIGFFK